MPKVSIIIAAYNIADYIERCLTSVINQTFTDIEIIVVNDGSSDNTLDIIKKVSQHDTRIKIINKQNEGLIEARKSGFKEATGEYILFIDGDDWIKLNAIEVLYEQVAINKYDIVKYKYLLKYDDGCEELGWDFKFDILEGYSFLKLCFLGKISHNIWSSLIRREFILENQIEFPSNICYGEDLALTISLAINKPTVKVLDEHLYYYYQRSTSLSNEINHKVLEIRKATDFIKQELIKRNLLERYKEEFEYLAFIQNYYIRRDYIFTHKNKFSRSLFRNWKLLKINLNSKNNKYYDNLYSKSSLKVKLVNKVFEKSYLIGCLYYKFRYKGKFV